MREVRLDLFKLYDADEKSKGSIKVILSNKSKCLVKDLLEDIKTKKQLTIYELSEKLGMKYSTLRMSFQRNRLSLNFIKRLLEFCLESKRLEVIKEIKELSSGTGNTYIKVKSPQFLTTNLCKIVGAIIADGNLYLGKNKRKWQIKIGDQYRDNLEIFSKWLEQEFGIEYEIKKDKKLRMFYMDFSNKIIFDYLNKIFGIRIGNKSSLVTMPEVIKEATFNYQIAFGIGLSMFDGGIGFGRRNFSLNTKSEKLIHDLNKILDKLNVKYSYSNKQNIANGLYQTYVWSEEGLRKILKYFLEPNTTKWRQLSILLNGFEYSRPRNLELISELYPIQRKTSSSFLDVINLFRNNTLMTKKEVQLKLNRGERTTRSLLNSLERMKVLMSATQNSYKVWKLNPNLNKIERR